MGSLSERTQVACPSSLSGAEAPAHLCILPLIRGPRPFPEGHSANPSRRWICLSPLPLMAKVPGKDPEPCK